ncbi:MAG: cysteine desulfurase [Christensenellaceae bacterium]|jgi:cysteine desulfurase|nr:cysteine desulfurase [Christensenellaceae bacterium]
MIYLDYAADTPIDPEVKTVFNETQAMYYANPFASHSLGRDAMNQIEHAVNEIMSHIGFNSETHELIPLSSATEANNLVLRGIVSAYGERGYHIVSTNFEHPSIANTLTVLTNNGCNVDYVRVSKNGVIDLESLKQVLTSNTILLSLSAVDSEVGNVQHIKEIAQLMNQYPNCYFHTDATQAIGKIQLDFDNVDFLTFSAHKIYGYKGSAFLIRRKNISLTPQITGGGAWIYRAGTPATPLIVSSAKAVQKAYANIEERFEYVKKLNMEFRKCLRVYNDVVFNSTESASPYILNLSVKKISGESFCNALDEAGICVSVKSACSEKSGFSKVVYDMSGSRDISKASWRISLSHLTTSEDVEKFMSAFDKCRSKLLKN